MGILFLDPSLLKQTIENCSFATVRYRLVMNPHDGDKRDGIRHAGDERAQI